MADENKWDQKDGNPEDDEEELDETAYKSAKDAVLFAIEVSHSMLSHPPLTDSKKVDTESPTSAALKCAYALMQQRIISNPNDMIGIILYGTRETKFRGEEQGRYPHTYLLTDLDIPAAEDVKALKALVEDGDEFTKLLAPSDEPVSMANVLFQANQVFTTKAPNFSSRRLFIITDDDDPHAKDKALKSAAAVRAKDLYDLGVTIELFPISKLGYGFDRGKFYNDIIYNATPSDPNAPTPMTNIPKTSSNSDGLTLLASLLSSVNSKAVSRRALFSNLPLEIGPRFKISVKGYIILKRQEPQRSCYVWLNGERPQIAKGASAQMADDTARIVEKVEIKKAYKFGGDQVIFTPEEISSLRHFGDPGIRIIGFKPMSMLPFWANVRPSTFIYPSEEDYVGSTRVFSALQQKLLKDEKMAVAWFVARKNAAPTIAAILPGAEKLDDNGEQCLPPGMWIVPLPYADDIRQNPEMTLIRAPESLINMMREVIRQLQLPKAQYRPEKYPNPSLQWHYRILQALALEEEIPSKPDDKTIPRYKQIDKRVGPYVMDWGHELESQYQTWAQDNRQAATSTLAKRPASGTQNGSEPNKKAKTILAVGLISDADMRENFVKNKVGKLTLPELKTWLKEKGLSGQGKKAELVSKVEEYFESK